MALNSTKVATKPFDGQKPGTSGLRKATKVFKQENYTENFVQATLSAMGDKLAGCSLAVGGDGRYYGKEAAAIIIGMCAGNRVGILGTILVVCLSLDLYELHGNSCLSSPS